MVESSFCQLISKALSYEMPRIPENTPWNEKDI